MRKGYWKSASRALRDEALGQLAACPENDVLIGGQLRALRFHGAKRVGAGYHQDHVGGVERVSAESPTLHLFR